ncbi:hypothetical protein ACET3Z_009058 [Daucus carota]|nr:PREDICTED: probable disease resistance protein At5g43730 isoform X1 [Daucus carota subsp. sativus]
MNIQLCIDLLNLHFLLLVAALSICSASLLSFRSLDKEKKEQARIMVGLSDIPCVGEVVDRISKAIVDAMSRGLWYVFCYKSLVDELDSEVEKLKIEQGKMARRTKEEKDKGKNIHDFVLKWQKDVEEILQMSGEECSPSCSCSQCLPIPDPVSRWQLGKNAANKAKTVAELTISGNNYQKGEIAQFPPLENVPRSVGEFQKFQSREDAYKELWEALVNEDGARVLGIHGMPGVGKTRMMEQIWKEAKEETKFDMFVQVDVGSEKIDLMRLQDKIADQLGFSLDSKYSVVQRASQLENSLLNRGKSLIIFDNVWDEIKLDTIGIPFGSSSSTNSCKILLTSRDEGVCLLNNCRYLVKIAPLTPEEAWHLFENTVGASKIVSLKDETLAKKVCAKCAGLPLVIVVIGKALKIRQDCSWNDTLDQLENSKIKNVSGIDADVYACLKLSFDNLEEDAKLCMLLCSLLPDDANIHIMKLVQLATGSRLVHITETRVCAMVDELKLSSLLLEGINDEVFKLHDIIRDLARSIGGADPNYGFVFARCYSSLPDNYAEYGTAKLLHLELRTNDFQFPHDLQCPDLHTLSLRSTGKDINQVHVTTSYNEKISGSMFGNLRFLVLVNFSRKQQFSLQHLDRLKTLVLEHCDISYIGDTDASFFPESLDSLCIWKCHLPVPLDLPNLKYLRKLEIQRINDDVMMIMVPNAISNLSNLKTLHIPAGYFTTEDDVQEDLEIPGCDNTVYQSVAGQIFDEISKLTRLTSLQISFDYTEVFQDTHMFRNLLEFNICVGPSTGFSHPILRVPVTRLIELHDCQLSGLEALLEKAEKAVLEKIDDFKGIIICSSNRDAFAQLRTLYIDDCNNLECLARISQNEIQHTHQKWNAFSRLTILKITSCSALKYLFCESVAKCFVQLQVLRIYWCYKMEVIVMNEGNSGGDIISFPKLESMELAHLPGLTSFHRKKHSGSTSVIDNSAVSPAQRRPSYDGMVAFPSLENLIIQWLDQNDTRDILLEIKKASGVQL